MMPTTSETQGEYFGKRSNAVVPLEKLSFVESMDTKKFRLHSRRTMIALSHVIEEHAADGGPETVLIAAFQRLSLFAVEAERYRRIASQFAQVYVLGVPDVSIPEVPNVVVVPLESAWPLVQEWSVIASGPRVAVGLFARDTEGFRMETRSRSFEGLFTTETVLIDATIARLHAALSLPPVRFERDTHATFQNTLLVQRALAARL
jgi:DICT domain-containing protein